MGGSHTDEPLSPSSHSESRLFPVDPMEQEALHVTAEAINDLAAGMSKLEEVFKEHFSLHLQQVRS